MKTDTARSFKDDARPDDDIGILDRFAYLNALGAKRPESVWQVNLFTYAWMGGPILWNTFQDSAIAATPNRDPNDLDGRTKDWGPAVLNGYPELRTAHLSTAVWKLWGCNAQTEIRAGIMAAQKSLKPTYDRNAVFGYDFADSDADTGRIERRHHQLTLAHFRKEVAENIADGYPGHVPDGVGLNVGCYGQPLQGHFPSLAFPLALCALRVAPAK